MDRFYRISEWHGRPNYECAACPFATLDNDLMGEHLRTRHGAGQEVLEALREGAVPSPVGAVPAGVSEESQAQDEVKDER